MVVTISTLVNLLLCIDTLQLVERSVSLRLAALADSAEPRVARERRTKLLILDSRLKQRTFVLQIVCAVKNA